MNMWRHITPLGLALLTAVGCAGSGEDYGSTAASSYAPSYGESATLPTIERARWEIAAPGCEGLLPDVASFGIAESQPELIVALDMTGEMLCVDTYSAVESELVEIGSGRADSLWLGYVATLQDMETLAAASDAEYTVEEEDAGADIANRLEQVYGDPNPEPNRPIVRGVSINLDIVSGDPNPEPNDEADAPMDVEEGVGNRPEA